MKVEPAKTIEFWTHYAEFMVLSHYLTEKESNVSFRRPLWYRVKRAISGVSIGNYQLTLRYMPI